MVLRPSAAREAARKRVIKSAARLFCGAKPASHIAENGYKYLEMADIS